VKPDIQPATKQYPFNLGPSYYHINSSQPVTTTTSPSPTSPLTPPLTSTPTALKKIKSDSHLGLDITISQGISKKMPLNPNRVLQLDVICTAEVKTIWS